MPIYAKDQPKAEYTPVQCVGMYCGHPSFFPEGEVKDLKTLFADLVTREWSSRANRGVHASALGSTWVIVVWWNAGWVEFGYEAAKEVIAKSDVKFDAIKPMPNENVKQGTPNQFRDTTQEPLNPEWLIPSCLVLDNQQQERLAKFVEKYLTREMIEAAREESCSPISPLEFRLRDGSIVDIVTAHIGDHKCDLTLDDEDKLVPE